MGACQGKPQNIQKTLQGTENVQQGKMKKKQNVRNLMENQELVEIKKVKNAEILQEDGGENDLQYFLIKQQEIIEKKEADQEKIKQQENNLNEINNQIGDEVISQHFGQVSQNLEEQKTILYNALNSGGKFTDKEFPANINSLTSYPDSYPKGKEFQWLRPSVINGLSGEDGELTIFQGISPQDIKQGALGDCYLLSSLSALAEHQSQNLISRLFEIKNVNQTGVYGVWLCIMGEWQLVTLDDFFPCTVYRNPAYSKANGPELWVLLIEKAYAKVYGNYKKIEAGLTGNAVRDLTGSSYIYLDNEDVDATWKMICEYDNNQNILTAGSQSDTRGVEFIKDNGVVSGHAYSILDHAVVQDNEGNECRILKLRNPWGSHEWTGKFSDNSEAWRPEDKEKYDVKHRDDGIFWIPIEDYCKLYAETTINFVNRFYKYSSQRVKSEGNRLFKFEFQTEDSFNGFISIAQKSDRCFEDENGQTDYRYSIVRMVVLKKITDEDGNVSYQYRKSNFKSDRDVDVQIKSGAGDYVVIVEIDWCQDYQTEFVISAYSSLQINFSEAQQIEQNEFESLVDFAILDKPTDINTDKIHTYIQGELLFRVRASMAGYVYFKYINESSSTSLQETVRLSNLSNLELCRQQQQEEDQEQEQEEGSRQFEVEVGPSETQIVKLRIHESGFGGYGYSMGFTYGTGMGQFGC
ncbi:hypothetical protein PPERSA_03636 [Pseudocohnilembus persalinus]|uniref:Calpain catalytic domain-containing protein n=1 Tax=Pseudocohnilembus persalinus TaxID=266149 RepID=A0A0V0QDZ9_PSEPJ|nr:hypothetical protein PPERSA_03636 [Pseudocohnilembus persalinus]|eukprot:KRX00415.1 hypothetical protein PPERSA_03636 [Pseudocohnilembus persalinus]